MMAFTDPYRPLPLPVAFLTLLVLLLPVSVSTLTSVHQSNFRYGERCHSVKRCRSTFQILMTSSQICIHDPILLHSLRFFCQDFRLALLQVHLPQPVLPLRSLCLCHIDNHRPVDHHILYRNVAPGVAIRSILGQQYTERDGRLARHYRHTAGCRHSWTSYTGDPKTYDEVGE